MANHETILIIPEGKVRDYVDGTIRNDTPEEYVRQTVEKPLVNEQKYIKECISVEYPDQMSSGKNASSTDYFQRFKDIDTDKQEDIFVWDREYSEKIVSFLLIIKNLQD